MRVKDLQVGAEYGAVQSPESFENGFEMPWRAVVLSDKPFKRSRRGYTREVATFNTERFGSLEVYAYDLASWTGAGVAVALLNRSGEFYRTEIVQPRLIHGTWEDTLAAFQENRRARKVREQAEAVRVAAYWDQLTELNERVKALTGLSSAVGAEAHSDHRVLISRRALETLLEAAEKNS